MVGLCGLLDTLDWAVLYVQSGGYRMRVLLVCPHTDLRFARSERDDWDAAIRMTVRQVPSPVTIVSVTRALRENDYDLLAFISHGNAAGILLDDGELLDYPTLAPAVRERVPYIFINTCESESIAQDLARDTGAQVVCTVGPVDDRHAYAMGSALAYWLDGGMEFAEAARLAVTPNQQRGFKLVVAPAMPEVGAPIDGLPFRRCLSLVAA